MSGALSQLLGEEASADAYYGFPAGFLEAQGNVESGNGANVGSNGTIFQVSPATASDPGFGLSSVNGNDPMSVGAYDEALAQATGGLGSGLLAYNEGIGQFTADGGTSATPAYQQLAATYGGAGVSGTTTTAPASSSGTAASSGGGGIMGILQEPIGDLIGGSTGAAINGITGSTSTNGTGSTSIWAGLGSLLGSNETDILFIVVGVMLVGAALLGFVLSSSSGKELAAAAVV